MEVLGVVVLVVFVLVVVGGVSSSAQESPAAAPREPSPPRRPAHPVPPTPAAAAARRRELDRQRRGDEAFFDGVVFGHYFLDTDDADDPWADATDGFDDDGDFCDWLDRSRGCLVAGGAK